MNHLTDPLLSDHQDDSVEARLRADVVFGQYQPQQWLKLVDIQTRYRTSQAEARRALANLCKAGYLEHRHNYGYRLPGYDPAIARDHQEVRVILERGAVPALVRGATPEALAALRQSAKDFEASIYNEGRYAQSVTNFEFHQRLYALTGNPVLEGTIRDFRERASYPSANRWPTLAAMLVSSKEHFDIVDALEARDVQRLSRVVADHIIGTHRLVASQTAATPVKGEGRP